MIVLINTFHVAPADQSTVIDFLSDVTRRLVSRAPGFIASILQRSAEGTKVTMYARWESVEAYEAMRCDPAPADALTGLTTLARFDMGMYKVVEEVGPFEQGARDPVAPDTKAS